MSPVTLRRVELRLFKNPATSGQFALPASGAAVKFYHPSTTATAAVEVHEQDTVTVPVASTAGFAVGENVTAMGESDRDFQVRSIGTNSLQLDYLGTSNFFLAVGERIRSLDPLDVYFADGGSMPPGTWLVADVNGAAIGYLVPERFDYEVGGTSAGSAAGYYLDGRSGLIGGLPGNVNARDFPSIQAAIDALPPWGGTVFIPAGRYTHTDTLYTPCDRPCHLLGEGTQEDLTRGTVLEWTTNVGMLRVRGDFSSVRNLTLLNSSGGQASREDEGFGIAIGRRNKIDAHPHPEPTTATPMTEYARVQNRAFYSLLIEDVTIVNSPGWGIHIPGVGKLSDETTPEYDKLEGAPGDGGTISWWLRFNRVIAKQSKKYGACFVGLGCTTTYFNECGFLAQGTGQVPNSTYYAYLSGCAQPVFNRCLFEGLSSTNKAWVRLVGTADAVFDSCGFENDRPGDDPIPPTYFIQLAAADGIPCLGGSIRHCRFIRGGSCMGHMSVLKLEPGGSLGFHIVGSGGVSSDQAWDAPTSSFKGPLHFDLGSDTNSGAVLSGSTFFKEPGSARVLQVGNAARASMHAGHALTRLHGATTTQIFDPNSDNPSMRQPGNLLMNWDMAGDGQAVGCPMYRWGGTDAAPKWRLVNNAPTLTETQRDSRSSWVQGDMILLVANPAQPSQVSLQVRLDSGWKTVTLS